MPESGKLSPMKKAINFVGFQTAWMAAVFGAAGGDDFSSAVDTSSVFSGDSSGDRCAPSVFSG
jgi:hypothetical protein